MISEGGVRRLEGVWKHEIGGGPITAPGRARTEIQYRATGQLPPADLLEFSRGADKMRPLPGVLHVAHNQEDVTRYGDIEKGGENHERSVAPASSRPE